MTLADSPPPAAKTETTSVDVLIIGSGISGSSLSFNLHKHHPQLKTLTTEARSVVGGNVISRKENGYVWEEGPNTFQPSEQIMRLAVDVGLKDDLVLADSTLPRFVYWDDKLFALPLGPQDIPTFRLLSLPGAIRAGLGALGFVLPAPRGEETVKQFITRHLGSEVFEKMIDPFVSGVYAGDPSKLAMQSAFKKIFALTKLGGTQGILEGGIIRIGQKKREREQNPPDEDLPTWKGGALGSFKDGLAMLPNAIQRQLGDKIKLQWRLVDVERAENGMYKAVFETPEGTRDITTKAIAMTTPAGATVRALKNLAPGISALEKVYYPPVWSVSLAYPKSEFKEPLRGFGNLIPRKLGIRTLGTIWSSVLFPGRAPEDMELLLSYIGGARDVGIKELSEEEVVKAVDGDVKRILLKDGSQVEPVVVGVRRWERAIPQYNLGHEGVLNDALKAMEDCEGIFLGGNFVHGVAFGDCVSWGAEYAPRIADYVSVQTGTLLNKS
ncbi:Protoporphyrinogen oxidase, chloroplastic [Gracilariopsis chorda]|uniref:Protoporphyrinogen oxidase n=1 Tax=Gracilariopsis chorda TaxID=448386 RepID=A0A2V3IR78_9FLOR|nr:Protoporphyrinogen oxidase, chloroplastic [Gracilariopsis chorda]|eukprot:PXF43660.1 Protoporphyrinogen oxidase, chloroplastic [Gracilariopsis chorda]